jgi:hypothetical protein
MRASSVLPISRASRAGEGFYFRVGHNEHATLNRLVAEGKLHADGLVLDARRHDRHRSLRHHADQADITTCLDTQAMELVMPGTASKGHAELPWAVIGGQLPEDFSPMNIEQFIRSIVARVRDGRYSQVMAPAHYVPEISSHWLEIDAELTSELRTQLDEGDLEFVRIVYPLAVHHRVFYDAASRSVLRRALRALPVNVISLRVHPFGASAGPLALRNLIEACRDFGQVDRPLMIERAGVAGISAYALGAVAFIESGITTGDSFDIGRLQKPPPANARTSFATSPRVYVEALGITVEHKIAVKLMGSSRGKLHFACRDYACCPKGYQSMLDDSERHSALARQRQYSELSRVPPTMRAEHFIHNVVTPVCDMLTRASDVHEMFKQAQRRMLSVKEMLIDLQRSRPTLSRPADSARIPGRVIPLPPREPRGR